MERVCVIRPVKLSEVAILRDLAETTFRDAWQDQNAPEEFEAYCREHFTLEKLGVDLSTPGTEFYFAWIGEQPAAYLKLNFNRAPNAPGDFAGEAVQLERIYVLQDFQSQRIGERLLRFSEERTRQVGATWLWLSVWQKSPRSIRFYEKNGFEIFGVETFWVGNDPQPDWLMRKKVDKS
ncbi:MAG TPA: GNAT family N-acetyltransferase [Saprospiraceae bacterium]|nr:GNAT family N-acetyltransferase [Saprospiraceae bacterium]